MLAHVHVNCAKQGCFAVITLHPQEERRLRDTHESFYCPAGHSNYFPGLTKEERELRDLRWKVAYLERRRGDALDAVMAATRALGVCPFGCGWRSRRYIRRGTAEQGYYSMLRQYFDRVGRDLADHLRHEHNATPEKVRLLTAGQDDEVVDAEVVS